MRTSEAKVGRSTETGILRRRDHGHRRVLGPDPISRTIGPGIDDDDIHAKRHLTGEHLLKAPDDQVGNVVRDDDNGYEGFTLANWGAGTFAG